MLLVRAPQMRTTVKRDVQQVSQKRLYARYAPRQLRSASLYERRAKRR